MIEETDYARYEKLMEDALDPHLPDDYDDAELEESLDDLWDALQEATPDMPIEEFETQVPELAQKIISDIAENTKGAKMDALQSMRGGI